VNWTARIAMNRFAVLGRVGMDLYADPPGTTVEVARAFFPAIGGSAGNIAVALARQGSPADLITRVSDDAVGRYCTAELARYGVGTAHVGVEPGQARTSLAVVETRPQPSSVLYRNGAADFALTLADVDAVNFTGIGALIVTGTALAAEPSRSATLYALSRARASGAVTVLDVDHRPYSWHSTSEAQMLYLQAARQCDIIIGNDEEFALLAGSMALGPTLAADLVQKGAAFTVYKRGADGCQTFTPDGSFTTPIFPVTAQKPMGAGDGFMGGLMAGLAQGEALPDAVRRGAATAAIIVAGVGCAPASPDLATLSEFIATA
jgi:5-dehydro-2-deoxygluconokinase